MANNSLRPLAFVRQNAAIRSIRTVMQTHSRAHAHTATLAPFHLAVPVHDLDLSRKFYGEILGCEEGRSAKTWIDWNLFGHQLVRNYSSTI
jgi:hypothetical protein